MTERNGPSEHTFAGVPEVRLHDTHAVGEDVEDVDDVDDVEVDCNCHDYFGWPHAATIVAICASLVIIAWVCSGLLLQVSAR